MTAPKNKAKNLRFLILDKSSLNVNFLRKCLDELGLRAVEVVSTLSAAMGFLDNTHFDIVIADSSLVDTDTGLTTLELLRQRTGERQSIVLTCYDHSRSTLLSVMDEHPDDLLLMPSAMGKIQERIQRVCDNHLITSDTRMLLDQKEYTTAFKQCRALMVQPGVVGQWAARKMMDIYRLKQQHDIIEHFSRRLLETRNMEWVRVALITALLEQGRHDDALSEAQTYARLFKNHAKPYQLLGKIRYAQNEKVKALQAYEDARRINPQCFETLCACADLSVELGQLDAAVTNYRSALKTVQSGSPESADLYIKLADAIKRQTELNESHNTITALEEAQTVLQHGSQRFPEADNLHIHQWIIDARLAYAKNQPEQARRLMDMVMENYGHCLHDDLDAAVDVMLTLNAIDQTDQAKVLLRYLEEHGVRPELNNVRQQLQRQVTGLEARSSIAVELNRIGVAHLNQNLLLQAIKKFREALDIMPEAVSINLNLVEASVLYMRRFRPRQALLDECTNALHRAEFGALGDDMIERYRLLNGMVEALCKRDRHLQQQALAHSGASLPELMHTEGAEGTLAA